MIRASCYPARERTFEVLEGKSEILIMYFVSWLNVLSLVQWKQSRTLWHEFGSIRGASLSKTQKQMLPFIIIQLYHVQEKERQNP